MSNEEHIREFKKANTEMIQFLLAKQGGYRPMITVLVRTGDTDEDINIIALPVPPDFLDSDMSKDLLAAQIPGIFQHLVNEGKEPICFSWGSEAWLRKTEEGVTEVPDNWKELPKVEALICTYESENESSMEVFEMFREGKIANEEGELIDAIRIAPYHVGKEGEKPTAIKGRFTNLFKVYKNGSTTN